MAGKKNTGSSLRSLQDAELALMELQRLEIERDGVVNDIEAEKAEVMKLYAERLADLDADIQAERKNLMSFLKENKPLFDGPPRSFEFSAGTIGYRLGQRHLEPLSKWTWSKVLARLQATGRLAFIRQAPQVDREAIEAHEKTLGESGLKEIGLRMTQDDNAFIEIKREPTPAEEVA